MGESVSTRYMTVLGLMDESGNAFIHELTQWLCGSPMLAFLRYSQVPQEYVRASVSTSGGLNGYEEEGRYEVDSSYTFCQVYFVYVFCPTKPLSCGQSIEFRERSGHYTLREPAG